MGIRGRIGQFFFSFHFHPTIIHIPKLGYVRNMYIAYHNNGNAYKNIERDVSKEKKYLT